MVKHAGISPKKFASLMKSIDGAGAPEPSEDTSGDPIGTLVFSFLLWESTTDKAMAAREKILQNVVDFNDLRVCMPEEIVSWIGARYPLAMERCQRLRTVLRAIFAREHAMTLESVSKGGKREAKKYIESIDGMVPYVAARVLLLAFDTHAVPADEQLRQKLRKAAVCDDTVTVEDLANWLTHHIKAGKGVAAHHALQAWVEERGAKSASPRKVSRNGSSKPGKKARA
ncbi:MAG TPA: hypothetical protein VG711_03145 [Phycisphaerales bacterium]|nr:hypothetical protein [Phycisphaerales bacterium]